MEKETAAHCSILAWRIPWTEAPAGLPPMGCHRVGHDWSDLAAADGKKSACNAGDPDSIPGLERSPGEGNGYPLQCSCLENFLPGQRSLAGPRPRGHRVGQTEWLKRTTRTWSSQGAVLTRSASAEWRTPPSLGGRLSAPLWGPLPPGQTQAGDWRSQCSPAPTVERAPVLTLDLQLLSEKQMGYFWLLRMCFFHTLLQNVFLC